MIGAALVRWMGPKAHRLLMSAIATVTLVGAVVANTVSPTVGVLLTALVGGMISSALATNTDVHVGLTYVTGTLVKSAQQLVNGLGTEHPWAWLKTVRFWLTFGVGALLGGFAFQNMSLTALWVAFVLALVACFIPSKATDEAEAADKT